MGKEECGVKEMYNFWGNAISIYTAGEIIVAKKIVMRVYIFCNATLCFVTVSISLDTLVALIHDMGIR